MPRYYACARKAGLHTEAEHWVFDWAPSPAGSHAAASLTEASFSQRIASILSKITAPRREKILVHRREYQQHQRYTCLSTHALVSVMDWARDNAGLSDRDLDNVFKYEEKSTTVVRMLADEKVRS